MRNCYWWQIVLLMSSIIVLSSCDKAGIDPHRESSYIDSSPPMEAPEEMEILGGEDIPNPTEVILPPQNSNHPEEFPEEEMSPEEMSAEEMSAEEMPPVAAKNGDEEDPESEEEDENGGENGGASTKPQGPKEQAPMPQRQQLTP